MITFSSYPSPEAVAEQISTEDTEVQTQFLIALANELGEKGLQELENELPDYVATSEDKRQLQALAECIATALRNIELRS